MSFLLFIDESGQDRRDSPCEVLAGIAIEDRFLEDAGLDALGLVVFDELERSRSHLLVDQMARYFRDTQKGRMRSGRVIPEPFFVHSDLTTGIQIADLIAYIIAWGIRIEKMSEPVRPELEELADLVCALEYRAKRDMGENKVRVVRSFKLIEDLRPREERFRTSEK
ncbi:MAG: DUF3800 domain-containing protein [Blastocatellia bacterium]